MGHPLQTHTGQEPGCLHLTWGWQKLPTQASVAMASASSLPLPAPSPPWPLAPALPSKTCYHLKARELVPLPASNHSWPGLHPNSYCSLACLVFRSCSLHLLGKTRQVHWKHLGSGRLPMVEATGEDTVNASWSCCD